MKKLWNNRIFWFIILALVLLLMLLPFATSLQSSQHIGFIEWTPWPLLIALPVALVPFILLRYFPSGTLSRWIHRVKKVFKIILMAVFGFMVSWYFLFFMMQIPFSRSGAWEVAWEYVKGDTVVTNKTGIITDYDLHSASETLNENASYRFDAIGQKKNAQVNIDLKYEGKWIVDTARYVIE